MSDGTCVEFTNSECIRESTEGLLIKSDEWDQPIWFPKSQVVEDSEIHGFGDTGVFAVTEWIAEEKELV